MAKFRARILLNCARARLEESEDKLDLFISGIYLEECFMSFWPMMHVAWSVKKPWRKYLKKQHASRKWSISNKGHVDDTHVVTHGNVVKQTCKNHQAVC